MTFGAENEIRNRDPQLGKLNVNPSVSIDIIVFHAFS